MATGSATTPVSAETVIVPPAPRFTVATAKTPVPVVPGIWTIPSFFSVALRATTSGTGAVEAESSRVLRPETTGAAIALAQKKFNGTSVAGIGAVGVKAKTNV